MLLDDLLNQREVIRCLARQHGAGRLRVFGSAVRREETPGSDVDFLVELPRGYDLFSQRLSLAEQLSRLLSRPVDLVPEHELSPHIQARVLQEAVDL